MKFKKEQIDYYIEKASFLAKVYEQQYQELYLLGDYLTEDIANDWTVHDISLLEEMFEHKYVSYKTIELYKEITSNFVEVSRNGMSFDDSIWTLRALKEHTFWTRQRFLAKKLLAELEKVNN